MNKRTEERILEAIRTMGRRDGRYGLDKATDRWDFSPARRQAYEDAYAEGAAHPVDVTAEDDHVCDRTDGMEAS